MRHVDDDRPRLSSACAPARATTARPAVFLDRLPADQRAALRPRHRLERLTRRNVDGRAVDPGRQRGPRGRVDRLSRTRRTRRPRPRRCRRRLRRSRPQRRRPGSRRQRGAASRSPSRRAVFEGRASSSMTGTVSRSEAQSRFGRRTRRARSRAWSRNDSIVPSIGPPEVLIGAPFSRRPSTACRPAGANVLGDAGARRRRLTLAPLFELVLERPLCGGRRHRGVAGADPDRGRRHRGLVVAPAASAASVCRAPPSC